MTRFSRDRLPEGHPFNPGPGKALVMPNPSARAQPNSSDPASTEPSNSDDPMAGAMQIMDAEVTKLRHRGTDGPSSPEPSPSAESTTPTPPDSKP